MPFFSLRNTIRAPSFLRKLFLALSIAIKWKQSGKIRSINCQPICLQSSFTVSSFVQHEYLHMPNKKQHPFLNKNIQALPFSLRMKKLFAKAGIITLKDLLKTPMYKWKQRIEGLTDRQRRKITRFVIWHDMIDYLKCD